MYAIVNSEKIAMQNILILLLFIIFLQMSCAQTVGDKPQQIGDIFLLEGDAIEIREWVKNLEIPWSLLFLPDGRIRDVVEGPDGTLYFLTNNRDGRGTPRSGDDRIYIIVPRK
jgi:glucose/arabinose dehydrogenase